MLPVTITPNSINILLDGRMRTLQKGHVNFAHVRDLVREFQTSHAFDANHYMALLRDLLDIPTFIARITEGRVQIGDDAVMFDGQPVQGVIADRLLDMLREGFDVRPLARFLDRVSNNPIQTARDEIYLWLESGNLPITDDGSFLAFKKVKSDYSSSHIGPDGKPFYNFIGTSPSMPRELVDANRHNTCSRGLHFCSYQYLPHFGLGGESKVVILKIAPEDVVSIPTDYNHSKGRAWRYSVIGEVPEDECQHLFEKTPVVDNWGLYDGRDDDEVPDYENDDSWGDDDNDADWGCFGDGNCHGECACDPDDDNEHDPDDAPEEEIAELRFYHGKRSFDADQISQLVADYGQRGVAKLIKVPRTTLQGWLKQIEAAS